MSPILASDALSSAVFSGVSIVDVGDAEEYEMSQPSTAPGGSWDCGDAEVVQPAPADDRR